MPLKFAKIQIYMRCGINVHAISNKWQNGQNTALKMGIGNVLIIYARVCVYARKWQNIY